MEGCLHPQAHQTWCTGYALQSLKAVAVNNSGSPSHSCFLHMCILAQAYLHSKPWCLHSLGLGTYSLEQRSSGTSADVSLWGEEKETLKTLCPTLTFPNTFPFLHPSPHLRVHRITNAFSSGRPQQWDDPHVCADTPDPGAPFHEEMEQGDLAPSLVSNSHLYHCDRWLRA